MQSVAIGIDVGGTGIKGAAIHPATGEKLTERLRTPTPTGGRPEDISDVVAAMVREIRYLLAAAGMRGAHTTGPRTDEGSPGPAIPTGPAIPIGITLPGVVRDGVMLTAANIDLSWVGLDAAELFSAAIEAPCLVLNDADAAGLAETALGAAADLSGHTMVLTFGTGIGSACIYDGALVPNIELGHLHLDGHEDIEQYVSPRTIAGEGLTIAQWAERAARYVRHLEHVMNPDRFVVGGGISRDAHLYLPFEGVRAPVIPARFRNSAGIVGAAWLAARER